MCEPASAASIAGLLRLVQDGVDLSGKTVVAVLTGHGLKDPATALAQFGDLHPIGANLESLTELLALP
jgi:threonine synthase